MLEFILYGIVALFISFTYFKVCYTNMVAGAVNGFGSLQNTLDGKNHAPAQLRPLTAYLWHIICRIFHLSGVQKHSLGYEPLRVLSIWLSMVSAHLFLNLFLSNIQTVAAVFFVALLYVATFKFDYTDNYLDITIFMLFGYCMLAKVNPLWMGILVLLGAINRESSSLLPTWYLLQTKDIIGALVFALIYTVGRILLYVAYGHRRHYGDVWLELGGHYFGDKKLNHGRFNWRENIEELKKVLNPWYQFKREDCVPMYSEYLFSAIYLACLMVFATWLFPALPYDMQVFTLVTAVQTLHVFPTACFNEFRVFTYSFPLFTYLCVFAMHL